MAQRDTCQDFRSAHAESAGAWRELRQGTFGWIHWILDWRENVPCLQSLSNDTPFQRSITIMNYIIYIYIYVTLNYMKCLTQTQETDLWKCPFQHLSASRNVFLVVKTDDARLTFSCFSSTDSDRLFMSLNFIWGHDWLWKRTVPTHKWKTSRNPKIEGNKNME